MKRKKGIELPINMLVIVAIAVIVLLGVIALYLGVFGPGASQIQLTAEKQNACAMLLNTGRCGTASLTAITIGFDLVDNVGNDVGDNLANLCTYYYGTTTGMECRQLCGCPQVGAIPAGNGTGTGTPACAADGESCLTVGCCTGLTCTNNVCVVPSSTP